MEQELDQRAPQWRQALTAGGDAVYTLLRSMSPLLAHGALRPFVDAYAVAVDVLILLSGATVERRDFSKQCMKIGRQFLLQGRIASDESVNSVYFDNFYRCAENRGLIGAPDADARILAGQLARLRRRMDYLRGLAESQRQGVVGSEPGEGAHVS